LGKCTTVKPHNSNTEEDDRLSVTNKKPIYATRHYLQNTFTMQNYKKENNIKNELLETSIYLTG